VVGLFGVGLVGVPAKAAPAGSGRPPLPSAAKAGRHLEVPAGHWENEPQLSAASAGVTPVRHDPNKAGFDPNKSKLVGQDPNTNLYQNPDGTKTAQVSQFPVNWRDKSGNWHRIDTSAKRRSDGRWAAASTSAGVDLAPATPSAAPASADSGAGRLVHLGGDGWSVGFDLAGERSGVTPAVSGAAVTYRDVLPGVSLVEHFLANGVKEDVMLSSAPGSGADASFSFPLSLSGLSAVPEADGSIGLVDSTGAVVASVPAGVAQDSSGDWTKGVPPAQAPVHFSLTGVPGTQVITATVDHAWLNDPGRVYPVAIDPTLAVGHSTSNSTLVDSYVAQSQPNTNYNGSAQWSAGDAHYEDWVGYVFGAEADSYQQFSWSPSLIPSTAVIISATWKDYVVKLSSSTPVSFNLWPDAQAYNISSVTYNTRPNHIATPITVSNVTAGTTASVDVTSTVQKWVNGSLANDGLTLDTGGVQTFILLAAGEDPSTYSPVINVTYGNQPPATGNLMPANGATVTTSTPALTANAVTNAASGDPTQYWFRMSTSPDGVSGQVVNSGWLTSPSFTPPVGTLQDGTTYYWEVLTDDPNIFGSSAGLVGHEARAQGS
jgi:hypothetical protein